MELQLHQEKQLASEMLGNQLASESDKLLGEPDAPAGTSGSPINKALHEQGHLEDANDYTNSTKSDKDDSSEISHVMQSRSILKRPKGELPTEFVDVSGPWVRLQPPDVSEIEHLVGKSGDTVGKTTSDSLDESTRSELQEVRFNSVQVRMYGQTLGDNPAVSNGAPIQLDWCYNEHPPIDINLFHAGRTTRPIRQLVLSRYYRHKVLMHWYNFTDDEIKVANQDAKKIRKRRQQTLLIADVEFLEQCLCSLRRFIKRMFGRK
ncbi:MAG: hypothetical protein SGBAC_003944 [Bacillariaceae sp.]